MNAGARRRLPIGVQSFESLRSDGYVYIDKTKYIYKLAHEGGKQYFLSRPRRFGKSLFLSALRAYWEGRKELFAGLDIERLEAGDPDAWRKHPVFYFEFNRANYRRETALDEVLEAHLVEWERRYDLQQDGLPLEVRFQNLIAGAHLKTGLRCVVLVDEYDKPLLESLDEEGLQDHNRAVFKGFFSSLKSCDDHLQFVLLTGITRFSKISIFSDLNQMRDISMNAEYAEICGITESELETCLTPELCAMSSELGGDNEACIEALRARYDGYRFHHKGEFVYNPYSLLSALADREFRSYWFETGTPTFLVRLLAQREFNVRSLSDESLMAAPEALMDYRPEDPGIVPLLYQTGYLTIRDYDAKTGAYILGFPNQEVEYGFLNSLLPEYSQGTEPGSGKDILSIRRYLMHGDLEKLHDAIVSLFAGLPYTTDERPTEINFQNLLYIVFTLLGQYVQCEVHSSRGRADCIAETVDYVYIFEFKRDGTADEALRQIEEKGYVLPYAADSRIVYRIGASFDSKTRQLAEWKVE